MQNLEWPRSTQIWLDRFKEWRDPIRVNAPKIWIIGWLGSSELAHRALNNAARPLIVSVKGHQAPAMSDETICLQV